MPGALILPVQNLESSKDTSKLSSPVKKDQEVYIYCSAGGPRSQRAAVILRDMGFKKAYFVKGGIAQWIATGNPIQED
jgi:rhodanese-related sulfurtransferase